MPISWIILSIRAHCEHHEQHTNRYRSLRPTIWNSRKRKSALGWRNAANNKIEIISIDSVRSCDASACASRAVIYSRVPFVLGLLDIGKYNWKINRKNIQNENGTCKCNFFSLSPSNRDYFFFLLLCDSMSVAFNGGGAVDFHKYLCRICKKNLSKHRKWFVWRREQRTGSTIN